MKYKIKKDGFLQITTNAYQTKCGAIVIDWGNDVISLDENKASVIAYDIKDFDVDRYNKFYKLNN